MPPRQPPTSAQLDPAMESNEKLVLAMTYDNGPEANIAMGMLRANGIPAILDNEIAFTTFGIQLTPTNGIRLMVRQCDLAAARALLHADGDN